MNLDNVTNKNAKASLKKFEKSIETFESKYASLDHQVEQELKQIEDYLNFRKLHIHIKSGEFEWKANPHKNEYSLYWGDVVVDHCSFDKKLIALEQSAALIEQLGDQTRSLVERAERSLSPF